MNPEIDEVLAALAELCSRFPFVGEVGGIQLYGSMPWVAPKLNVHRRFPALRTEELDELAASMGGLPEHCGRFLAHENGMHVFGGALHLLGIRRETSRTGPLAGMEPFGLVECNRRERPPGLAPEWLIVGGWDFDGSHLSVHRGTGEAIRTVRRDATPRNRWPSLFAAILMELDRLGLMFDSDGRQIHEGASTAPRDDE